jgi:glutamyl-tRNA reductase
MYEYAVIETCSRSELYSVIHLVLAVLSQIAASLITKDTNTETCSVDVAL